MLLSITLKKHRVSIPKLKARFIMKKLSLFLASLTCMSAALANPIAIIAPMPSEMTYLKKQIQDVKMHTLNGMNFYSGKIDNEPVVLVNSGIGKVDAAQTTMWLKSTISPKIIILTGSSGAVNPKLKIGDVIVGDRVFDADYGQLTKNGPKMIVKMRNPNNEKYEPTYFHPDHGFQSELKQAIHSARKEYPNYTFNFGTIVTSDALPNPTWQTKLFLDNKVDVVAMEDAAVDKVCWLYKMPCINIRSVSNVAGVPQSNKNTEIAARNAATIALQFIHDYSRKS